MPRKVGALAGRRPLVLCTHVLRIAIRELRNDVASVVRRAGAGERIVITVDGRPGAQLGPPEPVGPPAPGALGPPGHVGGARRSTPTDPPDAEDAPVDARSDWILDDI